MSWATSAEGSDVEPVSKLSRRKFLQAATAAAAAVGSGVGCGGKGTPWRYLSVEEARTLAAMCERIIPEDQDPGAAWAGCVNYIDRQLCGPLKKLREKYRAGIAAVNQSCWKLYGKEFAELAEEKQTEFLTMMEKGRAPSREFFGMVVEQTMQGFYGDPRHGGNRDAASWKMLGIPYPPVRGRMKQGRRE